MQGIAWFPEREGALLEALHRWAVCLPHMMLFHCCEGFDMDSQLKVSLNTYCLAEHVELHQHAHVLGFHALAASALGWVLAMASFHASSTRLG